jgi:DNA invertase Pin-like site-specific DNA recombinase
VILRDEARAFAENSRTALYARVALQRPKREELFAAVRRRELDAIPVWRLDRWGRSLADLVLTLKEGVLRTVVA